MSQLTIITTSYNLSHNEVTWEHPFTLNITDVEPDIYGYTVCVFITPFLPESCENATRNSIVIAKFSVNVLVRIVANNIVGKSNEIMHSVSPCSNIHSESGRIANYKRVNHIGTFV